MIVVRVISTAAEHLGRWLGDAVGMKLLIDAPPVSIIM